MSDTNKSVRQPGGRKKYFDNSHFPCGVCKDGCLPDGLGLTLKDMSSSLVLSGCCNNLGSDTGSADITYSLQHFDTLSDNCLRSNSGTPLCVYTATQSDGCGNTYQFNANISCVDTGSGYVMRVDLTINASNPSHLGGALVEVASGSWDSAVLPDGCGSADCSTFTASGDLFFGDTSNPFCDKGPYFGQPGFPTPTWRIDPAPCKSCDSLGAPCCCGKPVLPCYHVCINDPDAGCGDDNIDIRVCKSSDDPLTFSGEGKSASGDGASATLIYDPTGPSWTLTYSCNGGEEQTYTFTPGDGWSKDGNKIKLEQGSSAGPVHIRISKGPICLPNLCSLCCTSSGSSIEYDVDLGVGGWTLPSDGAGTHCPEVKGVYTVTWLGGEGTAAGDCATWYYTEGPPYFDQYCASTFCGLIIILSLKHDESQEHVCRWHVLVHFGCDSSISDTLAEYVSEWFDPADDCTDEFLLTKSNESGNDCTCSEGCLCNGSLPSAIRIRAVL